MIYLSAMIHTTIGSFDTLQVAPYVGITNTFLLSLFILAMAPATGGHINPVITFSTMVTGLTGFSRGILYMIGQTAGGALAGGLIRGSFGQTLTQLYAASLAGEFPAVLTIVQISRRGLPFRARNDRPRSDVPDRIRDDLHLDVRTSG